jgi:hypothetical protein
MADSTRFAKSASPRDEKRSCSAALSTGVGTPSSIPASSVEHVDAVPTGYGGLLGGRPSLQATGSHPESAPVGEPLP